LVRRDPTRSCGGWSTFVWRDDALPPVAARPIRR
jgi:hypothetical protein